MNLRHTFLWNGLIGISALIILMTIYNYYGLQSKNSKYWDKYTSEKYGTELNATRFYETTEVKDSNKRLILPKGKFVFLV